MVVPDTEVAPSAVRTTIPTPAEEQSVESGTDTEAPDIPWEVVMEVVMADTTPDTAVDTEMAVDTAALEVTGDTEVTEADTDPLTDTPDSEVAPWDPVAAPSMPEASEAVSAGTPVTDPATDLITATKVNTCLFVLKITASEKHILH